jgi:diguanylate cyclase (GGDEF)-like protein
MSDLFFTTDVFLLWHDWSRTLALVVLGLGLVYALLQVRIGRGGGRVTRLLTGGSLRQGLVLGLVLVSVVPSAAMVLLLSERSAHQRHDRIGTRLEGSAEGVASAVDQFLDKHLAAITVAARAISAEQPEDRESLTSSLLLYHGIYDDFLTMLIADAEGQIVTATSNMSGTLGPVSMPAVHDVSDRPYFRQPVADGKSYISEVFLGRDLGSDPIVAVSAPLTNHLGETEGIVQGSLDLGVFRRLDERRPMLDGSVMVLVDREDRVIYSSIVAALEPLQDISLNPMIGTGGKVADGSRFDYIDQVGDVQRSYIGAHAATSNGWQVYMRAPLDQIAEQMGDDYRVGGLLLGVALTLALLLASGLTLRVSRALGDMNRAIERFRLDGKGEEITIPTDTPSEFRPIFGEMRQRSRDLQKTHGRLSQSIRAGETLRRDLTQAVALRDLEIAERTAELESMNERLSSLSKSDPLTGIANRREFDEFAARVWRQAEREAAPTSIILIDVDYFKNYNDAFGHQAGDDCLRKIADALSGCAQRAMDLVARYGGEEFVAILAKTPLVDALGVAVRMRRAVEGLNLPHPESRFGHVTVSLGVAVAHGGSGSSLAATIKEADEALYNAKTAGRDSVVYQKDGAYETIETAAEESSGPVV